MKCKCREIWENNRDDIPDFREDFDLRTVLLKQCLYKQQSLTVLGEMKINSRNLDFREIRGVKLKCSTEPEENPGRKPLVV